MNPQIPYQVEQIISSLLNQRDAVHLRGNYRMRLATIREEIDKALKKYDYEVSLSDMRRVSGKSR